MSRAVDYGPGGVFTKLYQDRQWLNPFPGGSPSFTGSTFDQALLRTAFFSVAYSTSPGMAVSMVDVGAKYPFAFTDAAGNFLSGAKAYRLHLPNGIPAKLFWSVTVYDALTASGLDNGQLFPSINTMDKPPANADGSTDLLWPIITKRRKELAEDRSGERVFRDPAALWPDRALLQPDLAAWRSRRDQITPSC